MAEAGNLLEVVGEPNATEMSRHLTRYVDMLSKCEEVRRTGTWGPNEKPVIEAQLREHGSSLIDLAGTLTSEERASVNRMLKASQIVPLVSLGVLLALIIYIVHFLGRAIMAPLKRFQNYTRRIAAGDFSPILPARRFRDEFSDLALALNRMLIELKTHEEKCIQAAKMAAIGTLTSGVAHELNNPLNNIAITTETLIDGNKTLNEEERGKLLQDVYFETERASETVKSLLNFSRLEKPEMFPIDLPEVIQSAARLAENEMAINNVTLSSSFGENLPRVLGAANQLRHVFLNIFINGIQAMPSGGPLFVTAYASDNARVCVEIRDEGVGVFPEHLPHIFDPFFTAKEPGQGTGLGLSVSYRIIQKHGGDMQIFSEPGKGTTVQVFLPAA